MGMYVMLPSIDANDGKAIKEAAKNEAEMGNTWESAAKCLQAWVDSPENEGMRTDVMSGVMAEVDAAGKVVSTVKVTDAALENELLDLKDDELADEIRRLEFWDVDERPGTSYSWEAARRAGLYGRLEEAFDGGKGSTAEIEPILMEAAAKLGADIGEGEKGFYWYAFQDGPLDNDCGTGTLSYQKAAEWLREKTEDRIISGDEDALDTRVAVVSSENDYCMNLIKYSDLPYKPIVRYALMEAESPFYPKGLARLEGLGNKDYLVFDDMAQEVELHKDEEAAVKSLANRETTVEEININSRAQIKVCQYQVEKRTYCEELAFGEYEDEGIIAATRIPAGMDLYLKRLISRGDMARNQAALVSMEKLGQDAWTCIADDAGRNHYVRELLAQHPDELGNCYDSAVLDHVMPQGDDPGISPWLKWKEGEDVIYFPPEGRLKPPGSSRIGADEWREYLGSSPEAYRRKEGSMAFDAAVDMYGLVDFDRGKAITYGNVYQPEASAQTMAKDAACRHHVSHGGLCQ